MSLDRVAISGDTSTALADRIQSREARLGVIGLGYVGLPLAVEFARNGFDVTGFDVDRGKTGDINAGHSYIPDVLASDLHAVLASKKLRASQRR